MHDSVEDIGRLLRERREHLGYSLEDASRSTRIRKSFLENLENNQFSALPGSAYVTGFIRVYSCYLGLDSNFVLTQIEPPPDVEKLSLKAVPVTKTQPRRSRQAASGTRHWAFWAGILVVIVIGGLIYFLASMGADVVDDTITPTVVVKEPVEEPVAEPAEEPVKEQPQVKMPESQSEKDEISSVDEDVPEPEFETGTPEPTSLPAIPAQGASLRMLAISQSALIIYLDDRKPNRYSLHDGLDLTWKVKSSVKVELANVGAARFWLDGQELELVGRKNFQLQKLTGE